MLFTHMADPERDGYHMDGDDYTYDHIQGEIPGVSALAGLDPADDLRRENDSLRAALIMTREAWRAMEEKARREVAAIEEALT